MTTTTNYANGKVYKVEGINGGVDGDIYIGSTTKQYLSQRFVKHRSDYKLWLNGKRHKTTSFDVFEKYGLENCQITLIELVDAKSKDELLQRERYWIQTLKCVNKMVPLRTGAEYYAQHREIILEKNQQYYEANMEKIAEKGRHYRADNKEKIAEKHQQYRADNKEILAEKAKLRYEANKVKISENERQKRLAAKETILNIPVDI